ncbi:MAG: hypothetical protein LBT45_02545 [Rickettsiales bacterium]|nr:hypothetical protein [Rickettsiales bacterium]
MITNEEITQKFNKWAANPNKQLPPEFVYADIKTPNFREKMKWESTGSKTETEWIVSKDSLDSLIGKDKVFLLFPNPNKIDQINGDSDKIYRVIGKRGQKGTNAIKINISSYITEDGFIEYQGNLDIFQFQPAEPTQDKSASFASATENIDNMPSSQSPGDQYIDREIKKCEGIITKYSARLQQLRKMKEKLADRNI